MEKTPKTLPDCMMPDGAGPCPAYKEAQDEIERLRQLLRETSEDCDLIIRCCDLIIGICEKSEAAAAVPIRPFDPVQTDQADFPAWPAQGQEAGEVQEDEYIRCRECSRVFDADEWNECGHCPRCGCWWRAQVKEQENG